MTLRLDPSPRTLRSATAGLVLLAAALTAAPASAATSSDPATLNGCTDAHVVVLTADYSAPASQIDVTCDATLELAGHDLDVRNVVITPGKTFTVTDTSTPPADAPVETGAGTLTADGSAADMTSGIRNGDATFIVRGRAHVVARGGRYGAGVGGGDYGPGGTTATYDDSVIRAQGGYYAAGIGGGYGGTGGTTTSFGRSLIDATAGEAAAAIGGGALTGAGGNVTVAGGTVVASGGHTAIGGGTGYYGPADFGSLLVKSGGVLRLPSGELHIPDSDADGAEVTVEDGGVITGSDDETPTYATIVGPGQIDNGGSIRLPTANLTSAAPAPVILDHDYAVTFDPDGGSPAADPVTVYAASFTDGDRPLPTPTRAGYTFRGWYTADNTRITATTALPGSSADGTPVDVPLTARWDLIPPPGVPMSGVTITGDPVVGSSLTATPTTSGTPPTGTSYTHQWRSNGIPIPDATDPTVDLDPSLVGTAVTVRVTASAPGYSDSTVTSDPVTIARGTLPLTGVSVAGEPVVGSTLTATPITDRPDPDGTTYTYQWATGGDALLDATGSTLDIDRSLAETDVTVTVTGSAPGYEETTATSDPVSIASTTLAITGVTITGKRRENHTLHAALTTSIDLPKTATTTWAWYAGKRKITGTTGPDLLLGPDQVGRRIRAVATTTAPGRDTDLRASQRTARIEEGRYLALTKPDAGPGDTLRAYGRGPHRAQTYTLLIRNHGTTKQSRGRVGDNGAFRQRVDIPDRGCGNLTIKVKLANKQGKTIWTRTRDLALPPC